MRHPLTRGRGLKHIQHGNLDCLVLSPAHTRAWNEAFTERATTQASSADTILRIDDCNYYGGEAAKREQALATVESCGSRFLLFGRASGSLFETAESLALSPRLRALCQPIGEAEFRVDISIRELRRHR